MPGITEINDGLSLNGDFRPIRVIQTINYYLHYSQKGRGKTWSSGGPDFGILLYRAEIPIQLISLDYDRRVTKFGPVIEPSHSLEADMKRIQKYYQGVRAKYPDKFGGEYL